MINEVGSIENGYHGSLRRSSTGRYSVATQIENNQPIEVASTTLPSTVYYNEVLNVAANSSVTIIQVTVPMLTKLLLSSMFCSGDNIGVYEILVNDVVLFKLRTYFTDYNGSILNINLELEEADVLKVNVFNFRNSTADFNASIIGVLKDVT